MTALQRIAAVGALTWIKPAVALSVPGDGPALRLGGIARRGRTVGYWADRQGEPN